MTSHPPNNETIELTIIIQPATRFQEEYFTEVMNNIGVAIAHHAQTTHKKNHAAVTFKGIAKK